MRIKKFQVQCEEKTEYLVTVVDDNDIVITTNVFDLIDDAEAAIDMLHTIIARCGLQKFCNNDIPESLKSNISLDNMFKEIGISYTPDMVVVDN